MTDLTIGNETFKVDIQGDPTKPALILSHCLGADMSMWEGQMAALTTHFRVVRYDSRGHGGSPVGERPASIGQLGGDALAILDALDIDKAHWVGLSMGGSVGIWLLINAPERIDRAILANTAARIGTAEAWNARITSVLGEGMAGNAVATIERWFSPEFAAREPDRVGAVDAVLRGTSPHGYAACCAALRDMDMRAALGVIDAEVLVVTGRHDPVVADADTAALVEGIAGARHAVLEARHVSNIEAQADFNAAVVAFLTRPARKATARRGAVRKPAIEAARAKPVPAKRGGASRRSNAARNPLKKAPVKRAAKVAGSRGAAGSKKKTPARRRPAAKRTTTRRAPLKAAAAQPAKKTPPRKTATPAKTVATRRPTPTATARGAIKKVKPTKRAAAKSATKKTPAARSAPDKATTKKLPAARRKSTTKPRRPTGRRKT